MSTPDEMGLTPDAALGHRSVKAGNLTRDPLLVMLLLTGLAGLVLLMALDPLVFAFYDADSNSYIEAGSNLARGRGLVVWQPSYDTAQDKLVPMAVFPPGYSAMIYLGTRIGVDAVTAGIWIPRLCFLLLPLGTLWAVQPISGRRIALFTAVVATFLPSTVFHAVLAMADVPYLLLVLFSLAGLFRGLYGRSLGWVVVGGTLGGFALSTRNAGYALLFAVVAVLGISWGARLLSRSRMFGLLCAYTVGFALGYAPLMARNLLTFGSLQPYSMPSAGKSATRVLGELFEGIGEVYLGGWLPLPLAELALALLLLASIMALRRYGGLERLRRDAPARLIAAGTVLFYGLAGLGLLVISAWRFDLDTIGPRFLMQFSWILVGALALIVTEGISRLRPARDGIYRGLLLLITAALLAPQVSVTRDLVKQMSSVRATLDALAPLEPLLRSLPPETRVVSAYASHMHLLLGRPVYPIGDISPAELARRIGTDYELVVVLFTTEPEVLRNWSGVLGGEPPEGYREVGRSGEIVMLVHDRF